MTGIRTAIVGATGAVGRTMLDILQHREFPVSELRPHRVPPFRRLESRDHVG